MKNVRVCWMRHGESEYNANHLITPHDTHLTPLTPRGKIQADQLAQFVCSRHWNDPPDLIISSPYLRALQTAQPLRDCFPNVPFEVMDSVHEFNYLSSSRLATLSPSERQQQIRNYWSDCDPERLDRPATIPVQETTDFEELENFSGLMTRIYLTLTDLLYRSDYLCPDFLVFVVTHQKFIQGLRVFQDPPDISAVPSSFWCSRMKLMPTLSPVGNCDILISHVRGPHPLTLSIEREHVSFVTSVVEFHQRPSRRTEEEGLVLLLLLLKHGSLVMKQKSVIRKTHSLILRSSGGRFGLAIENTDPLDLSDRLLRFADTDFSISKWTGAGSSNVTLPSWLTRLSFSRDFDGFFHPTRAMQTHLRELTFGARFNQPIDLLIICESLTHLTLGQNFNCPLPFLPASLTHLTLGSCFNRPFQAPHYYLTTLPNLPFFPRLKFLSFGYSFNRPLNYVSNCPVLETLILGELFNQSLAPLASCVKLRRLCCRRSLVPGLKRPFVFSRQTHLHRQRPVPFGQNIPWRAEISCLRIFRAQQKRADWHHRMNWNLRDLSLLPRSIQYLDLGDYLFRTSDSVGKYLSHLTCLTHLWLGNFNCSLIHLKSDKLTHLSFGKHFCDAQSFSLDTCDWAEKCPNLQRLYFGDDFNCSLSGLKHCRHLTHLSLGKRFNRSLRDLPFSLTHLWLEIEFNQPLTPLTLLSSLCFLSLFARTQQSFQPLLSCAGLQHVVVECVEPKDLKLFKIRRSTLISDEYSVIPFHLERVLTKSAK